MSESTPAVTNINGETIRHIVVRASDGTPFLRAQRYIDPCTVKNPEDLTGYYWNALPGHSASILADTILAMLEDRFEAHYRIEQLEYRLALMGDDGTRQKYER